MNILILSCDMGEGYDSAAFAMTEAFGACGIEYGLADPLSFGERKTREVVSSSGSGIKRFIPSAAVSFIDRVGDIYRKSRLASPVYYANSEYAANLLEYIDVSGYDAIVCTHPFAMEIITAIRNRDKLPQPAYGIITDYTCRAVIENTRLDGYFIPHQSLEADLIAAGVPETAVFCTGIPLGDRFSIHAERGAARNYLVIPETKKVILVMTGGMSYSSVTGICDELLHGTDSGYAVYVIAGRNSDMKDSIDKRYSANPRIQGVTYTEKVNLYMNAADVMISRAGGLYTAEAAAANIPLVVLPPSSDTESENVSFLEKHGMAAVSESERDAASVARWLIYNKSRADKITKMQTENINPHASRDIARVLLELNKK